MPTSKFTLKPRHGKDYKKTVVLYGLKRIRTTIERAIKSFPKARPHILITVTTDVDSSTTDITIGMQPIPGGPDDKPPHPPRIVTWG